MNEQYALFLILAFIAEVLGTLSGFGSSILFVPLASLFFDFKEVLAITAIFHVFSNLSKIALFRKGIEKNIALKLGVPAVIFVIIGAALTSFIPTKQIEVVMSVIILLLAIYLIINFNRIVKPTDKNLILGGVVSGFLAGIAGTGGAVRGITLAAFQLPKDVFIATSALIDLGVDTSRAIIYTSSGYFNMALWVLIPFLIVIGLLGSYVGKRILEKTSEKMFRYIVLVVISVTAIVQVIHVMM